jgi:hypothetical protein
MAITTFTGDLSAFFPAGTSLEARPASNWAVEKRPPAPGSTPPGAAAATAASAATGVLSLTGLADNTEYYVSDSAGTRYVRITTFPERQELMTADIGTTVAELDSRGKVPTTETYRSPWHIEAFGGVPNDVTAAAANDAALVAAAAAIPAGGGAIDVSGAKYYVTDRLSIDKSNVQVYGDGPASGLIITTGSGKRNVVRFNTSGVTDPATVPRLSNVELCFMSLDCQGGDIAYAAGGAPAAILFYACDGVSAHHVICKNGRDKCFDAEGCTDVSFDHLTADGCYWQTSCNPIQITGSTTLAASDMAVTNCRVLNRITVALSAATRSGTTATFTASAAHKMSVGQLIKVTGCTPNDYNGFWTVVTTPTATTFTVTLNTTPSGSASVLGTVRLMADRGIYVGGHFSTNVSARGNQADHCYSGITCEADGATASSELQINDNIATNFRVYGVGFTTSVTDGPWAVRAQVNDNVCRGLDGTTAFGMAGRGSITGLQLQGQHISAADNTITNVVQGAYIANGVAAAVDETNFQITGGVIVLAADATGQGIKVEHTDTTPSYVRRLKISDVLIDGQLGAASDNGILLKGNITGFNISGNTVRGMGRSGIKLEASGAAVPTKGKISDNICVDNANAGSTAINKVGIAIDEAADDIALKINKCYDTRGGSALQTYGLHVAATATNVRSTNDDFVGNLTGEVNDLTLGAGFRRTSSRDPRGIGMCFTTDPRLVNGTGGLGAANRIVYARVQGGGLFSKVRLIVAAVDSSTPGTTDQMWVAVYGNKFTASTGQNEPSGRKAVSSGWTAVTTGNGINDVPLGATVEVREGDWIAVGIASATTTVNGITSGNGFANSGFNGYQDITPPVPPVTPDTATAGKGTSVRVPCATGVP